MFEKIATSIMVGVFTACGIGFSIGFLLCMINLHSMVSYNVEQAIGYTLIVGSIAGGAIAGFSWYKNYPFENSH